MNKCLLYCVLSASSFVFSYIFFIILFVGFGYFYGIEVDPFLVTSLVMFPCVEWYRYSKKKIINYYFCCWYDVMSVVCVFILLFFVGFVYGVFFDIGKGVVGGFVWGGALSFFVMLFFVPFYYVSEVFRGSKVGW